MRHIAITFRLSGSQYSFESDDGKILIEGNNKEETCARFMTFLEEIIQNGASCRVEAFSPLGKTATAIRATGAICRVGLKESPPPEAPSRKMLRAAPLPTKDFREPSSRILTFDPTPAGLITAPLRKSFKYLWKCLRDAHFSSGDFSCEICKSSETQARLIHAHEVYSYPNPKTVYLERVIFACYRCHDAIHLERTRGRASTTYFQQLEEHYRKVNGDLSPQELKADYSDAVDKMLAIREFYGGADAKPVMDYGPFQDRVEDILGERMWRKLGLKL